jgi:hypothetical protein
MIDDLIQTFSSVLNVRSRSGTMEIPQQHQTYRDAIAFSYQLSQVEFFLYSDYTRSFHLYLMLCRSNSMIS